MSDGVTVIEHVTKLRLLLGALDHGGLETARGGEPRRAGQRSSSSTAVDGRPRESGGSAELGEGLRDHGPGNVEDDSAAGTAPRRSAPPPSPRPPWSPCPRRGAARGQALSDRISFVPDPALLQTGNRSSCWCGLCEVSGLWRCGGRDG